jgi:hypothetical protein
MAAKETLMEISTDDRFCEALPFIKKYINNPNLNIKIYKKNDRNFLQVSAKKTTKDTLKILGFATQNAIAEVVITTMKSYYLQTHTAIPNIPHINKGAFIRALTVYDEKTDIIIAGSLIKIAPQILLDSLYDFRLNPMHKRWAEVAKLVNENIGNLLSKTMFDELLRFLISNLDHKIDEAHIIKNGKKICICDNELTPFDITTNNAEGQIINALIDISPKTIFIHSNNNDIEKKLIKNIEQIFPNCVTISYANINS